MWMGKWIDFELVEEKAKTKVWHVVAKEDGTILGTVKWFGRWRQYAFFPESDTVFEKTCLDDIRVFLIDQMLRWKTKLVRANTRPRRKRETVRVESSGAICGDGMCPYVPCSKFPKCTHLKKAGA
jgi:hypothetical protein